MTGFYILMGTLLLIAFVGTPLVIYIDRKDKEKENGEDIEEDNEDTPK